MEVLKLSGTMKEIKILKSIDTEWIKVVFAGELSICECCGEEPFCHIHEQHYSDCECIGPTEDNVEYEEIDGVLYGRRI